jgi:formate dehydrogenase gamma subunit
VEEFVRFSGLQRLEHWLLAITFGALLVTGLPQKFDDADLSVWIINTLGGIDRARFLHRILATVFMLESLWHLSEIGLSILRRRFRPTILITLQDFRDAFNMLRYSVGLIPEKPKFDRYDYRQKFEYWGIVFGAVIMIATGLALWFPTYITRLVPGELVPASKEMHSGEALLALLVIVVWHIYDVVLNPTVFPLDAGMITGKISSERLMEEHPREYARLASAGVLPHPTPGGPPLPLLRPALAPARDEPQVGGVSPGEAVATRAAPPQLLKAGVIRRSLQWRVMILVAIGLAGILAAFGISSLLAVNESIDHTLEERRALSEASAGHVDYVVRQGFRVLEEVPSADGFDLADSDPEPERRALQRAATGSIFNGLYLTNASGAVLWTEPLFPTVVQADIRTLPHVEGALESGRPSVSGLTTAVAGGKAVVSMVVPVRDHSGRMVGLVVGDVALNGTQLVDIIKPTAVGKTGYAHIVDSQGTILASTRSGELLQKSDHLGQVATLIQENRTSSGTCHDCHEGPDEGERQTEVMAFAPLQLAPWGVLIRQSESEALAPAQRLKERAIWFGVPAFALALLFAWATVRSVLRPVRTLTAAAQKISSGDLSEPVPRVGEDEIGGLARAFETMRGRLKESLDRIQAWSRELEVRVQERTHELEASRDHLKTVAEENASLYEELKRKEVARSDLLKKVITAQEEERRRIARDLHDDISQALTALALGMETAALTPDGQKARVQEKLDDLKELAVRTLEGVHRLIYDLRPSVLDDLGLVAGLRWYAESRLQPAGVRLRLLVTGQERRLPIEVETALFRIGQEAISNVARHAHASTVFLSIDFQDSGIVLEVEDDGEGFDVAAISEAAPGRPGWGILGMQERATLLGGTLELISEPGSGTHLQASIRLEGEGGDDAKDSSPHS